MPKKKPYKVDGRATWRFNQLPDFHIRVKRVKLKECPFCGSEAAVFRNRYKGHITYSAVCMADVCAVRPRIDTIHDARFKRARGVAAVWNKRND